MAGQLIRGGDPAARAAAPQCHDDFSLPSREFLAGLDFAMLEPLLLEPDFVELVRNIPPCAMGGAGLLPTG